MVADGIHQGRTYAVSVIELPAGRYSVEWVDAGGARSAGPGVVFDDPEDALAAGTAIAMQIIELWGMVTSFNTASSRRHRPRDAGADGRP